MTVSAQPAVPGRNRLLWQVAGSLAAATILAVLVILPAEYGADLTGFGRLVGLDRLRAPIEVVVETTSSAPPEIERVASVPFRSDEVALEVVGTGRGIFTEVEYKVTMQPGETLVYEWSADGDVYFDFHGHAERDPNGPAGPVQVMNYRSGTARSMSGTLVAPMAGIHGWYFRMAGSDARFTVRLKLSGFYELTPGRLEVGNPLARAR